MQVARKGRELEILVSNLETVLTQAGFKVESPYFANTPDGKREIDIGITGKVGKKDILIAIECRDRKKPQGIEWLEQATQKKRSIKASEMILISSSGFVKGASTFAGREGLTLRRIINIKFSDIIGNYTKLKCVFFAFCNFDITQIELIGDEPIDISQFGMDFRSAPLLSNSTGNSQLFFSDIFHIFDDLVWGNASEYLPEINKQLWGNLDTIAGQFSLFPKLSVLKIPVQGYRTTQSETNVKYVKAVVYGWLNIYPKRLDSYICYTEGDNVIFQGVFGKVDTVQGNVNFQITKNIDGDEKMKVTVKKNDSSKP